MRRFPGKKGDLLGLFSLHCVLRASITAQLPAKQTLDVIFTFRYFCKSENPLLFSKKGTTVGFL